MKKIDGLPVGNGAMPIRLKVTKLDIAEGVRKNSRACAIAVACQRRVKGCTAAKIHMGVAYLFIRGGWYRWRMTEAAKIEAVAFDRGGRFFPDEYDLLPVPTATLVKRATRARTSARSRTKRRKPHRLQDVRDAAYGNDG